MHTVSIQNGAFNANQWARITGRRPLWNGKRSARIQDMNLRMQCRYTLHARNTGTHVDDRKEGGGSCSKRMQRTTGTCRHALEKEPAGKEGIPVLGLPAATGRPTCQGRRFVATCDSTPICRNGQSTNLSEIVEQNTEASQDSRPTSGGVCVVRLVRTLRIRRSSQARTKRSGQAGIHPRAATGDGRACC